MEEGDRTDQGPRGEDTDPGLIGVAMGRARTEEGMDADQVDHRPTEGLLRRATGTITIPRGNLVNMTMLGLLDMAGVRLPPDTAGEIARLALPWKWAILREDRQARHLGLADMTADNPVVLPWIKIHTPEGYPEDHPRTLEDMDARILTIVRMTGTKTRHIDNLLRPFQHPCSRLLPGRTKVIRVR